jgi:signal transduction histidine kinase
MNQPLRILLVEDTPSDAELAEHEMRASQISFHSKRVESKEGFLQELNTPLPDIILADFTLPQFSALEALRLLKSLRLSIPFILVTGSQSEEVAVECMKAGADDYILKTSLKRLPQAVLNVLAKKRAEREKREAEEGLRSTSRQLRALAARLQNAREEERKKIAREIHDELGQMMTAVKIDLAMLDRKLSGRNGERLIAQAKAEIAAMQKMVDTTIKSVRKIATELRPDVLDNLGLLEALQWQAQEFEHRTGIPARLNLTDAPLELDQEKSIAVFRIFQETLTNIARHAKASEVDVTLRTEEGKLLLVVADDGRGITDEEIQGPGSLGLLGMRERSHLFGGEVQIARGKEKGTIVTVTIPLRRGSSRGEAQ